MAYRSRTLCLSFVLVLSLLACAAKPVLAEAPPPPGDEGGMPQESAQASPSIPGKAAETEAEEQPAPAESSPQTAGASPPTAGASSPAMAEAPAVVPGQWVSPPMISAGGVGPATAAEFISDEQMLDAGGVLRAQGETLAALFAAGAIACPSGKTPVIYGGSSDTGCTPYYNLNVGVNNPIQQANNDPKTTTGWWIWVSPGYTNSAVSTFLGKSVTVKGDPQGTSVAGGIGLQAPNITLRDLAVQDGQIFSSGLSGTLRLLGISVTGTLPGFYGIDIKDHRGSIYLANVTAAINGGGGAALNTGAGTGTVTVLNSAFNHNTGSIGLLIFAKNAVRVENVSTSNNAQGMHIEYRTRLTLKNINASSNSLAYGIHAEDTHPTYAGPVTLSNITANGNAKDGIFLQSPGPLSGTNLTANENQDGQGIYITPARGSVTLNGVTADGNDYRGLRIISSSGAVSISNARISNNRSGGVVIASNSSVSLKNAILYDNNGTGLNISNIGAAAAAGVTLTNLNVAENVGYGIQVTSKGTLNLSGISARGNDFSGTYLATDGGAAVSSSYGANSFTENGISASCAATPDDSCNGLHIDAKGAVSISSTSASANGFDGIGILQASSARVTSSTLNDNFRNGLRVNIKGAVTLDRVTALHNHGSGGIELWNTNWGPGHPGMSLSHVAADHNNWGIQINSLGAVTLNHVGASYNTGMGIYIDSGWGGAGLGNVTLTNSLGSDLVSFNGGNNLEVHTASAVTIRGLNASGSRTGMGAYIKNDYGTGSVSVSSSDFNRNGDLVNDPGLMVLSKGSLSLNTVNASGNQGVGADLHNYAATLTGKTVSVSKGVFNENGADGLTIESKSSVTLNNVSANGNHGNGAVIDNYHSGAGSGNVSVSSSLGRNQFSHNGSAGLVIITNGSLSVSNTEASRNGFGLPGGSGIHISSHGTGKTAVFTCVSAANNLENGIRIANVTGSIKPTLKGVWLGGNGAGGLFYDGASVVTFVTMTCQ